MFNVQPLLCKKVIPSINQILPFLKTIISLKTKNLIILHKIFNKSFFNEMPTVTSNKFYNNNIHFNFQNADVFKFHAV